MKDTYSPAFPTIVFDHDVWAKRHNLSPKTLIESSTKGSVACEDMIDRWKKGEPAPYLVNHFYFRDRCFQINPNAYITDPEATYLVDVVKAMGNLLIQENESIRPRITEFGIGAGTLAISVALECLHFQMSGFDLDSKALEVARENQKLHQTQIEIFESDFFQAWPHVEPPDLIFADPPWGSRDDLYDDDRDAEYYDRMPPLSAYPKNGRIGLHEGILDAVGNLGWSCPVVMNLGVIPADIFQPLLDRFKRFHIYHPTESIRILIGFVKSI